MKESVKAATTGLYSRDQSLDPQLVWKGKDEQDSHDLEVPVVPIYIQEKIQPRAIIEDLRDEAQRGGPQQADLFGDFNGIKFEELLDFYQHEQNWSNRMILGDSLMVMTSLAEKERLKGQVQCIYMDPPYGIKFGSNWQVSTRKRNVQDGKVEDATRQPEQVKAFRDTWELGVHSYLSYLRDRLAACRGLLSDTGSLFVQMGDQNLHLVRAILDEVFGSENFVSQIAITKSGGGLESTGRIPARLDYILWYSKAEGQAKYRPLFEPRTDLAEAGFNSIELNSGERRPLTKEERSGRVAVPPGRIFRTESLTKPGPGSRYEITWNGHTYDSGRRWWGSPKESVLRLLQLGRVIPSGNTLRYVRYVDDFPLKRLSNLWDGLGGAPDPQYVVQTNTRIVERCILLTTDPGDLVLDPTCGSGTTAIVAEEWGRRWITVDTSRVALALARQRLMVARYPYYVLADSREGARLLAGRSGDTAVLDTPATRDVRKGFVYRSVPRVTMAAIANSSDIQDGMSPQEVDSAIMRHADSETLYDQPEVDPKIVRVTGSFTVESLSPHVAIAEVDGASGTHPDDSAEHLQDSARFHRVILEHLRKAGVQNTVKSERLGFDDVQPWAGSWVHAIGDFQESGVARRAAISIGPQYGTVDGEYVRNAAKEAAGFFELLIVCGFAFDGYMADELKQLGNLTILKAAMNPDLAMGDELLKKTGSGNLFMVFGEPDIDILHDGQSLTVEIRGVDVYDPTTGEIRSHTTDDIACWFIDSAYNRESFFVRQAYFLGGGDPYEALRKALRADIDEDAWTSLYSTKSREFPVPQTGKIAIKVINHYGDEITKVFEVGETRAHGASSTSA